MKWLRQKDFWTYWENSNSKAKIDFENWCYFRISEPALRNLIGDISPNQNLEGEDDPPGPVSRWYGNLNGIHIILDFHQSHPNGEVVILYHDERPESRAEVREHFVRWGEDWQESEIA